MLSRLVALLALSALSLAPLSRTDDVSIYVNGEPAGTGFIVDGTTYVPLRLISEKLGATVEADGKRVDVKMAVQKSTDEATSLADLKGTWYPAKKSLDCVRIKDPVVVSGPSYAGDSLEFDFQLLPGLLSTSSEGSAKPHEIELYVILYGSDREVLWRGNVRVPGVPTDGGRTVLRISPGSTVYVRGVTSIYTEFVAAWFTKDK